MPRQSTPLRPVRWSRRQLLVAGTAVLALPSIARAEPLRLRIGHGLPSSHPVHAAMVLFADRVRERTGGAIEMTIFADGLIGQEPELITLALELGADRRIVSGRTSRFPRNTVVTLKLHECRSARPGLAGQGAATPAC